MNQPDSLREKVIDVWSVLLGEPPRSDDENFFEDGGHSVLAMRFVWLMRERYEIDVHLRDFLEDASVGGVLRALASYDLPRSS